MSNFLRILLMVIALLFGGFLAVLSMIYQVIYFLSLESLDGYFNVLGMTYVLLALTMIVTNIPSIFYHVKIMRFKRQTRSIDIIDDSLSSREEQLRETLPSRLLRNFNLIFCGSFLLNYIISMVQIALNQNDFYLTVVAIFLVIIGTVLFVDGIVSRSKFRVEKE